jgi:hypothetical protein
MTSTGRRSTSTRHAGAWAAMRSTSPSGPVPPVTAMTHRTGPVNLEAVAYPSSSSRCTANLLARAVGEIGLWGGAATALR